MSTGYFSRLASYVYYTPLYKVRRANFRLKTVRRLNTACTPQCTSVSDPSSGVATLPAAACPPSVSCSTGPASGRSRRSTAAGETCVLHNGLKTEARGILRRADAPALPVQLPSRYG